MKRLLFLLLDVYKRQAQDALIEELYAEPEEDPIEECEAADPAAATPESEVTG